MTVALLVVGAGLELVGLLLVALDVRHSQREVERRSRPDQLVQVGTAVEHARAFPVAVVGGGKPPEPSLEERVSGLEAEVSRLDRDLRAAEDRETQAHREMTDRMSAWVAEARRETFDMGQHVRTFAANVAAGDVRRRGLGVGLFAAGLILQTVGNLAAL